ncbi:MAG: Rab family GTPase [Hyphomicrobiaceae bacterium]
MISRKLMLLGEIGVGKTSLIRRLVAGRFETEYKSTFGVELYRVPITRAGPNGDQAIELIVWDTDGHFGQSIFRHVYIKGASAALIIGDLKRRTTLESMVALAEAFQEALPGRHFSFLANKVDLVSEDETAELPARLREARQPVLLTSAKTGANVEDSFIQAATSILRREG